MTLRVEVWSGSSPRFGIGSYSELVRIGIENIGLMVRYSSKALLVHK